MAERIDGKAVAEEVVAKVKAAAERSAREAGVTPGLAVVIVGEDPASQVYVVVQGEEGEGMRLPFRPAHAARRHRARPIFSR